MALPETPQPVLTSLNDTDALQTCITRQTTLTTDAAQGWGTKGWEAVHMRVHIQTDCTAIWSTSTTVLCNRQGVGNQCVLCWAALPGHTWVMACALVGPCWAPQRHTCICRP